MLREITNDDAQACEVAAMRTARGIIIDKAQIPGIAFVRAVFDAIASAGVAVPNGEQFDRTSHAIGPLYIRSAGMDALNRVLIAPHEGTHIDQFWQGEFRNDLVHEHRDLNGGAEFAWLYATQPLARIRYEVRADRARWEVMRALGLPVPTVEESLSWLFGFYALPNTPELRDFTAALCESNRVAALRAAPQSPLAIAVIDTLRTRGVIA